MAFFDEIGKRMNGIAQSAQKSAEVSRLQRRMSGREQELEQIFTQLGKLYHAGYQLGEANTDAMNQMCASADAMRVEIAELQKQIDALREVRRCESCGSVQNMESRFCASCGAKLPDPPKPEIVPEPEPVAEPEPEIVPEPEIPAEPEPEAEEPVKESASEVEIRWPDASAPEDNESAPAEDETEETPEGEEPPQA